MNKWKVETSKKLYALLFNVIKEKLDTPGACYVREGGDGQGSTTWIH